MQPGLDDADPARAAKYGLRSGQNPRLAWSWFRNNPVGFNGVPYVLLRTNRDLDPNDKNPTLRAIARIWKREATMPAGSGTSTAWTLDHIGVGPDPSDYVNGVARPASQRQTPLPFGFAFENPREFEPLTEPEKAVADTRLLARRVFKNTTLLVAKLKTADKEENWEHDSPGFGATSTTTKAWSASNGRTNPRLATAPTTRFRSRSTTPRSRAKPTRVTPMGRHVPRHDRPRSSRGSQGNRKADHSFEGRRTPDVFEDALTRDHGFRVRLARTLECFQRSAP